MADGVAFPPVPRGTLLPVDERVRRLEAGAPHVLAVALGETDAVALEATLSCLLWELLAQANWCGFYRRVAERALVVGPYQGALGCLRIAEGRGVCGACVRTGEVQIVPDVSKADHIVCDPRTRSEIVLPVRDSAGALRAVLDVDSTHLDGFAPAEVDGLVTLVNRVFARPDVVF